MDLYRRTAYYLVLNELNNHYTSSGYGLIRNIKAIREAKGLKQIDVAKHIGVDKSAYSKIEKGTRALTVDELYKMAQLFNMSTDQIINYDCKIPKEVVMEDKTAVGQMRPLQQLDDDDDRQTIFKSSQNAYNQKIQRLLSKKM